MSRLKGINVQMSQRERNILLAALAVALLFLANILFPMVQDAYRDRQSNIDDIYLDIAREARLVEETPRWAARRRGVENRREELEPLVFSGATVALIEANIQRDLTRYARDASIYTNSTRLAELLEAEDWLLVSQEMSFRTDDATNTIEFLNALENSTPRLFVKDFSLDRSRQQYSGSITVVGFARRAGLANQERLSQR